MESSLPKEYGSVSIHHRRFQQWVKEGAFEKIRTNLPKRYDDIRVMKWKVGSPWIIDNDIVVLPFQPRKCEEIRIQLARQ